MKALTFCCLVLIAFSCRNSNAPVKVAGAYLMEYQSLNDGKQETKYTDLAQLKIYTDSFMMYTQVNPVDTIASFGVGSYITTDSGSVVEKDFYSSREGTPSTAQTTFNLQMTIRADGFTQVIPQIVIDSQNYKLTEEYHKVGIVQQSPLDGLWKEISSYTVRGKDTIHNDRVQYKAFYAGYFCFGSTSRDSSGKSSTNVGFGTFTPEGENQMRELDLNSSAPIVVGQSFSIQYEMDGSDKYNQTIHNADSSYSREFYQRVGK